MKKSFKKILTIFTALAIAFNVVPTTPAQAGADKTAYLMYADSSWTYQYWSDPVETGVVPTDVTVTGPGDYTVGLDFTKTADGAASGLAFTAIGLKGGEQLFPGYTFKINSIKVNDKEINFTKGFTNSDDKKETRMNIYNSWVTALPEDARSYDGDISTASPTIVDPADFESVKTIYVNFTLYDEKGAPKDTTKDTTKKTTLSVQKTSVTIAPGKSATLTYKASGSVTVKSANTKVATVKKLSGKKIQISVPKTAKKGATTTITLKSGSKSVKVKVTVKK